VFSICSEKLLLRERDGTEARFIYYHGYHFHKTRWALTVPGESSFTDRAKTPTSDRFKILKKNQKYRCVAAEQSVKISIFLMKPLH
jgi:hypothetical protein